jgi:hypothetical protein
LFATPISPAQQAITLTQAPFHAALAVTAPKRVRINYSRQQ